MQENDLSYKIRGAIFNVYNTFGPGLLESVYEAALKCELETQNIKVQNQVAVPVFYNDKKLDMGFRIDLLVDDKVIIEIKSVESLAPVHHKQLLTYLKLTDKRLGLLINFNTDNITSGIVRIANNL